MVCGAYRVRGFLSLMERKMMQQKPIRVLHIVTYMGIGGLETMLMNVFRNIDREKVQFDFLVHRSFRASYDDEIETLGGRIYRLPKLNPFSLRYRQALDRFFREHPEYRIVHCHQDCLSAIPLAAAQRAGIPVRIAHSHTSSQDNNLKYLVKRFYMTKIPTVSTHFFACSKKAGKWMFPGQQVTVINNGIETERFAFSSETRREVRKALGICDELVLGHVGSFVPTKNHSFLLDVFKKVQEKRPDAKLVFVGNGPREMEVRQKTYALGLKDSVHFLGLRTDVNRLYQAMDVFVMPSVYEGLGIAAVEAQASGLRCVLSDTIPSECQLTGNVKFMSLSNDPEAWAEEVLRKSDRSRMGCADIVLEAGYDIKNTAIWLQNFYLENWDNA